MLLLCSYLWFYRLEVPILIRSFKNQPRRYFSIPSSDVVTGIMCFGSVKILRFVMFFSTGHDSVFNSKIKGYCRIGGRSYLLSVGLVKFTWAGLTCYLDHLFQESLSLSLWRICSKICLSIVKFNPRHACGSSSIYFRAILNLTKTPHEYVNSLNWT